MPAFSVASRPSNSSDIMRFRDQLTRPMACRLGDRVEDKETRERGHETSLSRACSTATTKRLLFRLTAFAKSQRGNHECRSCDLPRGGCLSFHPGLEESWLRHTTTRRGALAASYIQQRRPVPHVSGQINGLRHKASITARGASDHNPYQVVLQTMALHADHHMSYRS